MTLSNRAIAALNGETTDEVFMPLVKIEHSALASPIRVASNNESIFRTEGGTLVEYVGLPFELELPSENGDNLGVALLGIQNVDRVIVDTLRTITSPPTVTLMVVLAATPDVIEVIYSGLKLSSATYDVNTVRGTLTFEDLMSEPISLVITPDRFPGAF